MKGMFDYQRSTIISSNYASTSGGLPKSNQEIGSSPMPKHAASIFNDTEEFSAARRFPQGSDLNPARAVLAEMVGTFILMFCISGIIESSQLTRSEVDLIEYAATAALTIIVVIFSIGSISGAHVNPAITLAFATFGHFPWSKVVPYIVAQTTGSVLATYVGKVVYGTKPELMLTRPLQGCNSAFWVELIATFILMFLASSLTFESHSVGHSSGFVIGIAIGLSVLITGPVSGGSLNPARSMGPAIVAWNFNDIWIYIVAPIIGALTGSLAFHILWLRNIPCTTIPTSSPNNGLLDHTPC